MFFSLNSMYHKFSKLFDSQDLTFHLIFVKSCSTVSSCFYVQNKSKKIIICFMLYSTSLSKKIDPMKKKPKAIKDRGGGLRVNMTVVKDSMFF